MHISGIYSRVPQDQEWRVALLRDLLELRWNTVEIELVREELDDLEDIIGSLCVM